MESLDDILRRFRRLQHRASGIEEELDQLELQLRNFKARLDGVPVQQPPPASNTLDRRGQLKRLAANGVAELTWDWQDQSGACVRFDQRTPVPLTPAMAELLRVLGEPGAEAGDGMAGWKSKQEIASALTRREGKLVRPEFVKQRVSLLRKRLLENGENPYLIQSAPGGIYRLPLRQTPPPAKAMTKGNPF